MSACKSVRIWRTPKMGVEVGTELPRGRCRFNERKTVSPKLSSSGSGCLIKGELPGAGGVQRSSRAEEKLSLCTY
jgi:hypothetical protein